MNLNPVLQFAAPFLCLTLAVAGRAQASKIGPPGSYNTASPAPESVTELPVKIPPITDYFPSSERPNGEFSDLPQSNPRVTFFPPVAPVYGAPIIDQTRGFNPTFNGRRIVTPGMLADFVNENFYPALGTHLAEDSLSQKILDRLQAYQAARTALINELNEQIHLATATDPAACESALRAFAVVQTPRILALGQEAEQLRQDLVNGTILQASVDWNEIRDWKLGPNTGKSAEFQVIRAAAFFSDGFSPAQRGLLRELAMELQDKIAVSLPRRRPPPGSRPLFPTVASDPLAMFFSPETSRLRLPPKLPADISARIGVYNHDKDELKSELRDAVVAGDRSTPATRTENFRALADRQASRLAGLEARAEEIRRGLAALPAPPPPAYPPGLPPQFLEQLNAYRRDRAAFDAERFERLIQGRQTAALARPTADRTGQASAADSPAMNPSTSQASQDFRQKTAELQQRAASLSASLTEIAANRIDPATGKPTDPATLLRMIAAANQEFDRIGREEAIYHDYRIAMLLPGLSPEQRRLLFGAAMVGLAQPLPTGELMPPRLIPY